MCGVVAALGSPDLTEPMKRLAHRGVRSKIMDCGAGVVGHVRLPIVGLDEEHDQPMWKDQWLIGFVGQLLDFRETNPGMECDAELVRDLWVELGPHGFRKRDGFWGIVALHQATDTLHVLTDYLGQKPMYYRADFPSAASEPDALIPFGPVTFDHVYMSACIKWGYCPDLTRTPYNEIKHVLPGEHVVIGATIPGSSDQDHEVYRTITDPLTPLPWQDEHNQLFSHEIAQAVKRRVLSSDVPVACLVSGGVDSAIVYTLASRYGDTIPYHVAPPGVNLYGERPQDCDAAVEYQQARSVIRPRALVRDWSPDDPGPVSIDLKRLIVCSYGDVSMHDALAIMQEPIDLGSLRPQIALAEIVKERVCLTGDGADEMFGGYGRSTRYDSQWSDVFQELPAWHLPRLDRAMMRHRIEVRSPFLARRVAQMALSVPHHMRRDKFLLRNLFSNILPPGIANAPKKALRTAEIAHDREAYSKMLVTAFMEQTR